MKIFFTLLMVYLSLLNAGEIQRIESIANDISQLRTDYSRVQSDLVEMEVRLEEKKEQNKILHQDLKHYKNKVLSLENKINTLKESLQTKEKDGVVCKMTPPKIIKTKVIVYKNLNNQNMKDDNKFPNLQMKEEFETISNDNKAFAYRIKNNAKIYDAKDGIEIETWEKSTSFTSNVKTQKWVKITGYFVDKVWKPSQKELWIKSVDVLQRDNSE